MAVNEIMVLAADTWVEATPSDTSSITAIHRSGAEVLVSPRATGVTPAADDLTGLPITTGAGYMANGFLKMALTDLTHVVLPVRIWLRAKGGSATVFFESLDA